MLQDPAGFRLMDLLRALWKHKWKASGVVVVFLVAGIVISLLVTPIYRAETLLAPVTVAAPGPLSVMPNALTELMRNSGLEAYDQERNEALAILRSREFTSDFIREEQLMPVLYEEQWDARNKRWRAHASGDTPTVWLAYQKFNSSVRGIHDDYTSGLITLSIEWTDPALAASWANSMVARVNEYLQQRAIREGEKSLEFLRRELQSTNAAEVRAAIYRLIEAQMQRVMVASVKEEYGFRILDPAVPPEQRIRPNRKLVAVIAFFLGVIAASALSVFWESKAGARLAASGGGET